MYKYIFSVANRLLGHLSPGLLSRRVTSMACALGVESSRTSHCVFLMKAAGTLAFYCKTSNFLNHSECGSVISRNGMNLARWIPTCIQACNCCPLRHLSDSNTLIKCILVVRFTAEMFVVGALLGGCNWEGFADLGNQNGIIGVELGDAPLNL